MKIAFSTLGCPDWSFEEIYATAKDLGFDGIEIRGIGNELFAPKAKPFLPENIEETKAKLSEMGLAISMLTTGSCVGVEERAQADMADLVQYVALAARLGVKYLRVMVSPEPGPTDCNLSLAVKNYREICEFAEDKGVTPLIETNGALAESVVMKHFMESVNMSNSGVLWDINHPVRFFGEDVKTTYANIGKYIKYVHVKDSLVKDGKIVYKMMGYGDLPLTETLSILDENNYDSYISLEWVKRWNPDLQEPGIVFSHFISYMKYLNSNI